MTNEIQNRVARAIAYSDGLDWEGASEIQREEYTDNARAAIAEMADHTQADKEAAVAAAYEDCWGIADAAFEWTDCTQDVADAIRARSNTDADALAERDVWVKAEALKEAAEHIKDTQMTSDPSNPDDDFMKGNDSAVVGCAHAILALIPDQHKDDG